MNPTSDRPARDPQDNEVSLADQVMHRQNPDQGSSDHAAGQADSDRRTDQQGATERVVDVGQPGERPTFGTPSESTAERPTSERDADATDVVPVAHDDRPTEQYRPEQLSQPDDTRRQPEPQAGSGQPDAGRRDAQAPTERPLYRDPEPSSDDTASTAVTSGGAAAAGGNDASTRTTAAATTSPAATTPSSETATRSSGDADATRVVPVTDRATQRAERDHALGKRPRSTEPEPTTAAAPIRSTDRFAGSAGLFILRVVLAAVMGMHGVQKLINIPGTQAFFESTALRDWLPGAVGYVAIATGVGEVLIALGLLFGFLTRAAGLFTTLIGVGALVLVKWLTNPIHLRGEAGFTGELDLLVAACGLLFLFVGAGGWSLDHALRRSRARKRAERG